MKSGEKRKFAKMCILVLGGFYLCYHGLASSLQFLIGASVTELDSAYAFGKFVGEILNVAFPVVVGIGLLTIAYSRMQTLRREHPFRER